jgi:hypothetical protein
MFLANNLERDTAIRLPLVRSARSDRFADGTPRATPSPAAQYAITPVPSHRPTGRDTQGARSTAG